MTSIGAVPALRNLPSGALAALERASRGVRFRPGAVIRPPGEPARGVLLLLSGTVVAVHTAPSGAEVWPERWVGPAIVDKSAVLDGDTLPTGLVAITAVNARLLARADFLRLLDEQEPVRARVLATLARDVMAARLRLARSATLPALAQVAAWLHAQDPTHRVAWRGSQEQLGHLLGLSRVTVNRALARLSAAGAIRLTPQGVVVADRERLDSFSNDP